MRNDMTPDLIAYVSQYVVTTALAVRLDFESEPVFVWTGIHPIAVSGSGDPDLDGNTFETLANGVAGDIGENTFSYSGSTEMTVSLGVPADPGIAMTAASIYRSEYLARSAILWRAVLYRPTDPLGEPTWVWRRIRTGKMDKLEITNDGSQHNFILTIEAHQANISNASNQTYLNQRYYDPSDSSQDYSTSIANGKPAVSSYNEAYTGASSGSSAFDEIFPQGGLLNKLSGQQD